MPKSRSHAPKTTDHRLESTLDPNQPGTLETPRTPGDKAPEANSQPRRPDDTRDQGLIGGAAPTAPAKHVAPGAQRRGQEEIDRKTRV